MGKWREETRVSAADVTGLSGRVAAFLKPYLKLFERREQRAHAEVYVEGRWRQLSRRTLEPIATERGLRRRPLQHFVGAGKWDDGLLRDEQCRQVAAEMGSSDGVLIMDGSGFQKAGPESVGTQRQWLGRLGKEEQCQVGEFLAYAAKGSVALVDCELYLPETWASDPVRRKRCYVPENVTFKTGWQLAAKMVLGRGQLLPHRWVVGDENYGRPTEHRDLLNDKKEQYLLEVPFDAKVRLARGGGWIRACDWAGSLPKRAWQPFTTRDGEKGPISVRAVKVRVFTPRSKESKRRERPETLVVVRSDNQHKTWTYLGSDTRTHLRELVRVGACRHGVEQALHMGKGEVGLDEYEVRSWIGWHHHMTLTMLSLWFLVLEHRRVKKTLQRSPLLRSVASLLLRSPSSTTKRRSHSSSPGSSSGTTKLGVTTGRAGENTPRPGSRRVHRWGTETDRAQVSQSN